MTSSIPEFRSARCVRYRYRYSECRRCEEACPHEAVALTDEGITLDAGRCRNCALCVSACRTGALAAGNLKPIELLKRAIREPAFSFACAPSGMQADAIVPCLGALDAPTLGYLAKRRIPAELRGAHGCETCVHGARGAAQLALTLEGVEVMRAASGEDWLQPTIAAAPEAVPGADAPVRAASRRHLFRRLIGRGIDQVAGGADAGAAPPVAQKAIRAGPPAITEQRELLAIVCKVPQRAGFAAEPHAALPWMDLRLDPGCTACEACMRVCPTGTLMVSETEAEWMLRFDPDRCVACEVCLEVCQPRVLNAAQRFDASPGHGTRVLHKLNKQRCSVCDRFFTSPEPRDRCDICRDDDEAFSAIFG